MRSHGPLIALVLAVYVLVGGRVMLGGKTWDDVRYHAEVAPPRLASAGVVSGGQLPTWWEGSGLGVPLLAEPSHGAAYPVLWIASSPRLLDALWILHVVWLALGIALFARRLGASELGMVLGAVLVATSGIVASTLVRGALPALAFVPWVAWAALGIARATDTAARMRGALALGICAGACGLAGQLAVLVDALLIAVVLGAVRGAWRWLAAGLACGLAIACVQWIPAVLLAGDAAGATVGGLKLSRLLELVIPGSFGALHEDRAVSALAGEAATLPSLYAGAGVFALAALARPARRVVIAGGVFAVLALVAGRGGWPAWLGAPELHLAVIVVIAGVHAARGVDAIVARDQRSGIMLATAAAVTGLAVVGMAVLRTRNDAPALDRALVEGLLAVACLAGAAAVAWSMRARELADVERRSALPAVPVAAALLVVVPSIGALGSTAPLVERGIVDTPPAWAEAAQRARTTTTDRAAPPLRVFRPLSLFEEVSLSSVDDAIATLAGTSAARHGLGAARSEDPARPPIHDDVWLAAAAAGGALLDRYGISVAILPSSLAQGRNMVELGQRGSWSLVQFPASPPAALVYEWIWIADTATAIARLFPPGAGRGLPPGLVVLSGSAPERQDEPRDPEPCLVVRWDPGAIDLTCTSDDDAYAVVSSTAAPGWTVHVDGVDTRWATADVIRRAVAVQAGPHLVSWRYQAPGLVPALAIAGLGLFALAGLGVALVIRLRRPHTRDRASRETS